MKNNPKSVELKFELPGFDKKDIKLKLSKNSLSVNASKKQESKIKRKDFFHQERIERHFSYATTLPTIQPKKAKIEFKKGILKIKAPKE
jgi:HSP20 family protein